MTQTAMSLAERIRKIAGFGVLASASDQLILSAPTDAQAGLHWQAYEGAIKHLLALIVSPEGQAALHQLEEMALMDAPQPSHLWARHTGAFGGYRGPHGRPGLDCHEEVAR